MSHTDDLELNHDRRPAPVGDRIAGAVLLLLALGAWWHSHSFVTGFMQPVGPGAFPRLVSLPLGVLSAYLLFRPGFNERWPDRAGLARQLAVLLLLAAYAGVLEALGFLPATLVGAVLLTRLFGARWQQAMVAGTGLAVGLYVLFEFGLGMPLPNVPWWGAA
ncbi:MULTISPECIES: tripartite tricarboxylate transporter TctB family protein [Halomonas]|uniref:tripartite tricarboxylate transporter TctB family protein n=1 Tax=Halomonas TaxID=2745 RepID=UPI001A8C4C6B|nr:MULTISPECIES: tripartite tricarboxylate transporter TctB family protein [Halomonas]MBN8413848.1 tripartite tricarboxylate transporter TctB family protein [Halomonas litopenaei]MBY5926689.1 tripartite tricarboxylate transporter TctB family protein [Halomonas sp. DP4Y7-2]MBY6205999.1 tripartite tricarboxylate transporter TctB family protein [Halomonas sp. DP3Y7-2]MBY6228110.1 tripartite tricarboxylate transporter TctB family protein [Halomonas sp. DP3Y7-1]MBY6233598.1 tripartite tricarboxylat